MSNALQPTSTELIDFGNEVLYQLHNMFALVPLVRQNIRAVTAPGPTVTVPDFEIVGDASERNPDEDVVLSDVRSSRKQVSVKEIYKAISIDNLTRTFSNVDDMTEAATRLALKLGGACDKKIAKLYLHAAYSVGKTDGSAMFNSTDDIDVLSNATEKLVMNQAPVDDMANIHFVLHPKEAKALRQLTSFKQVQLAGQAQGRELGLLGRLMGWNLWESQQIVIDTLSGTTEASSGGTAAINNAPGYKRGDSQIALNSLGTGTVQAGSQFNITGINNENGVPVGFVVTDDATITSNAATVNILPKLPSDVADATVVTFVPLYTAAVSMNMGFHRDAITAVIRQPESFWRQGPAISEVVVNPETGLSVRITYTTQVVGTGGTREILKGDMIFGCEVTRPELLIIGTGKNLS